MSPNRINLLIIDDEIKALDLLKYSLESDGFNVTTVANGIDGLTLAQKKPFDLIILDIIMHGLNGWEVCKQLKENSATKEIPVVFLTALSNGNYMDKANKMGAALFISKPIAPDRLSIILKKIICNYSGS